MYDAIIVGAGPAGISASLYIKRANLKVLVLYYGESELEKAHKIDNYYGFKNGITGKDLYEAGIEQAKNLGIEVRKDQILKEERILKEKVLVIVLFVMDFFIEVKML